MRALVTGASAGIGEAFVKQLAARCDSIVLVARREDRLRELIDELSGPCTFELVVADLASQEGQARVVEAIRQGEALDLLINNAGFSTLGPFVSCDLDKEIEMLRLHQEATLSLSRAALPAMCQRGQGAIINVSSIGGLVEMPNVAVYGATKAFLVSFSRSLREELRDSGVRVQCLCPGYTRTEIHSRDSFQGFDTDRVPDALWMESDEVVAESLGAIFDSATDRWLLVPGAHNRSIVERSQQALTSGLDAYP